MLIACYDYLLNDGDTLDVTALASLLVEERDCFIFVTV